MTSKAVSSRYGIENGEWQELEDARGELTASAYQKRATLEKARGQVPTPEPEPEPVPSTWADHMGINAGPIPSDAAIQQTKELGLKWINCSPENGWFTDTELATMIQRLKNTGLKVWVTLQQAGHNYTAVVQNPGAFARYAKFIADLKPDAMTIGNEWNNHAFWNYPDVTMKGPATIHKACIQAIRPAHPLLPVYSVGWSPNGGLLSPSTCQANLGTQLMNQQCNPSLFTGCSHHPYCYNGPLTWGVPDHPEWNAFTQTPGVWAAAKQTGMTGPMSLNEYGCPSAGTQAEWPHQAFSEDYQAKMMAEYLQGFKNFRAYGLPIDYVGLSTAIDGDAVTTPIESSMGMYRVNLAAKPAAAKIRDFAKSAW